jgi:putative glutamine amidotransferase
MRVGAPAPDKTALAQMSTPFTLFPVTFMSKPLLIGISARIHHADTPPAGWSAIYGRTLHYLEQSVAHWVLTRGVLAVMIPAVESQALVQRNELDLHSYAEVLDGLVLQGGADLSPLSYGDRPLRPEWSGDLIRDRYEIDLFNAFLRAGKPILGICRGCQLMNVALGGTLYQDIPTQIDNAGPHRDDDLYDEALHDIDIVEGSRLSALYGGLRHTRVNSLHHQAVRDPGRDIDIEARGRDDGVIEAIRWKGPSYAFGVQWHPEFLAERAYSAMQLDGSPILNEFLEEARVRRKAV